MSDPGRDDRVFGRALGKLLAVAILAVLLTAYIVATAAVCLTVAEAVWAAIR